jgi:exopolysaccharide biosynthesis WecB/TagA/CpsF family protein
VRSGTTLLRMMLHSHPELAIPREIHLTLDSFLHRRRFGDLASRNNREAFADWLISSGRGFDRLGLDPVEAKAALVDAPPTVGSLVGTLLRMYATRHNKPRFGEKRPMNVVAYPVLHAMFPDLRFVDVVRDPRAVIASERKLGWIEQHHGGSFTRSVSMWVRAVSAGREIERCAGPGGYLRIRYEDLVSSPEATLTRLCKFAELDPDHVSTMLRYHETDHEIPDDNKGHFHPLIDKPLTDEASERWRKELTAEETAFIEWATGKEMDRFGYDRESAVSPPSKMRVGWPSMIVRRRASRAKWSARAALARESVADVRANSRSPESHDLPMLGVTFSAMTPDEALDAARRLYERDKPAWIALQNAHGLNLGTENVEYRHAVRRADVVFNDGKGVMIGARLKRLRFPADLNGNFLTPLLLAQAGRLGWPVFFYGAKPGVAERAAEAIRHEIPSLNIVGIEHGYTNDREQLLASIRASGAGLLLVGLGNPHQELWLDRYLRDSGAKLGIGVGAFFDFKAGEVKRAPGWLNRIGLEWAHRLFKDPKRMWRRYLLGNPLFLWRVLRERKR